MRLAAEKAVKEIPGVTGALVTLTAEKKGGRTSDDAPHHQSRRPDLQPLRFSIATRHSRSAATKPGIPGVGAIIAVASGRVASASPPPRSILRSVLPPTG